MPATLLDGKQLAQQIRAELAEEVVEFIQNNGVVPCLAAVLVGDDPASEVYVRNKRQACEAVGIESQLHRLPADVASGRAAQADRQAEQGRGGPRHPRATAAAAADRHDRACCLAVSPAKDVDAFHPENVGRLVQGRPRFLPCTPHGVQQLLVRSGIEIAGQHVVIVGRSDIVGKPLSIMLSQRGPGGDATVTLCHSRTRDLPPITRQADILIVAIGRPKFVTADMVQARRRGGRRGHQSHRRRAGRRRRFRRGPRSGRRDHARARRRRPADDRHAAAQHAVGRRKHWKRRSATAILPRRIAFHAENVILMVHAFPEILPLPSIHVRRLRRLEDVSDDRATIAPVSGPHLNRSCCRWRSSAGLAYWWSSTLGSHGSQGNGVENVVTRMFTGENAPVVAKMSFTDADKDLVADPPTDAAQAINPDVLVFSYVASEEERGGEEPWKGLLAALKEKTGKEVKFTHYTDVNEQLAAMKKGELHIAGLNTGLVPIAVDRDGFVPLCTLGRDDGTFGYTMEILVPAGSPIKNPAQIKGHKVTFTRPDSNSGCKAPFVLLMEEYKLLPERDYQWNFSLGHEDSIKRIAAKEFEVAPVASDILARMVEKGEVDPAVGGLDLQIGAISAGHDRLRLQSDSRAARRHSRSAARFQLERHRPGERIGPGRRPSSSRSITRTIGPTLAASIRSLPKHGAERYTNRNCVLRSAPLPQRFVEQHGRGRRYVEAVGDSMHRQSHRHDIRPAPRIAQPGRFAAQHDRHAAAKIDFGVARFGIWPGGNDLQLVLPEPSRASRPKLPRTCLDEIRCPDSRGSCSG